ncbi:MAG: SPFH domain-containing protein [Cyanobacteriota/Melainabacteria group bacterium]|nr:SPFH domain-containing protein [Cyanobacteria bacterium HKST-UBA01]MCB9470231.1 SPFH domain-containing protein [Candidatus Obscuribacterales bacterium]
MFNMFKKQFIDVIDWTEDDEDVLAYRYPVMDMEIQTGAQLTVRESQMAVFVNEGNLADVFSPGRYELSTKTLPVLTTLLNWDKAFKSPFKSDVYFFSTREKVDQRWGTQQPITIRDKEFGPIRLRAFGTFSYKIEEPSTFHQKLSGTRERYTVSELDGQLRSLIVTTIASKFGGGDIAFLDMAANQTKLSEEMKKELDLAFFEYGLKLCTFLVQSITLPEELQQYLDKQSSMNLVGDLNKYATFQAADSIKDAAKNEGGLAGAGVGLGAGAALGQAFASALGGGAQGGQQAAPQKEEDPFELLEKLQGLLDKGIISQEEFDSKKADILKRIS